MPLKRFHIVPFLLALLGLGLFQQSGEPSSGYSETLGFSLLPGANSRPVTFYIIQQWDDPAKPRSAVNITQDEFTSIAYGWGESRANPNKEDLFQKYDIANCGYRPDTVIRYILVRGGLGCRPLDDLWKLGHSEWPYHAATPRATEQGEPNVNDPATSGKGWARNLHRPSEGQVLILQQYGITEFIDIFVGEKAFQLLHDMQNPEWVAKYIGA